MAVIYSLVATYETSLGQRRCATVTVWLFRVGRQARVRAMGGKKNVNLGDLSATYHHISNDPTATRSLNN